MKTQFAQEFSRWERSRIFFFRNDMDSPIQQVERVNFKGLNHSLPDESYRVSSKLERFDSPRHIAMATSSGTRQTYLRYGAFAFEVKGQSMKLIVYKSAEEQYARGLFLPFSDETSGHET